MSADYSTSLSSVPGKGISTVEPPASIAAETVSFRDPGGCLVRYQDRVFRFIGASGEPDFRAFQQSPVTRRLVVEGKVIGSEVLQGGPCPGMEAVFSSAAPPRLVLEHEAIRFPSYPFEWTPQMLYEAGLLTIEIAEALLEDNLGLKDATPYNILFRGPRPVFIDVLSVERREPLDPLWRPYAQFVRTFCIPLLVNKRVGVPIFDLLIGRRDGLEPEEAMRWLGFLDSVHRGVLGTIVVPALLGRLRRAQGPGLYAPHRVRSAEQARFTLKMRYRAARRLLRNSRPDPEPSSEWSDYEKRNSYSAAEMAAKDELIRTTVLDFECRQVLDLGCNTGRFSAAALRGGAAGVVAVDRDPAVIDRLYRRATNGDLPILPLVIDFARPSPATGWRNSETLSFFERASGRFDCVMALAFLHHMLVSERIPLPRVLTALSDLTTDVAIVEFVAPEDPMFRALLRGRDELHRDFSAATFERAAAERFDLVRSHAIGATRSVYVMRKRSKS